MTVDHTTGTAPADQDTTRTAVAAALAEVLGRPLDDLSPDASLFHEVGLDSTGVLDLLMSLEERLGLELDMESLDMEAFATVETLAAFLRRAQES